MATQADSGAVGAAMHAVEGALWEYHDGARIHKRHWDAMMPDAISSILQMRGGVSASEGHRTVSFHFDNVRVEPPSMGRGGESVPMTPTMAAQLGKDYASKVRLDFFRRVEVDLAGGGAQLLGADGAALGRTSRGKQVIEEVVRGVWWTQVPTMVGTALCTTRQLPCPGEDPLDVGGTFLIGGMPKQLFHVLRDAWDKPMVSVSRNAATGSVERANVVIFPIHPQRLRSTSTMSMSFVPFRRVGGGPGGGASGPAPRVQVRLAFPKEFRSGLYLILRLVLDVALSATDRTRGLGVDSRRWAAPRRAATVDDMLHYVFPLGVDGGHMTTRVVRAMLEAEADELAGPDGAPGSWVRLALRLESESRGDPAHRSPPSADDAADARQLFRRHVAKELLPHVGVFGAASEMEAKARVLGEMARRVVCAALCDTYGLPAGVPESDAQPADRSDLRFKRIATGAEFVFTYLRQMWDDNAGLRRAVSDSASAARLPPIEEVAARLESATQRAALCKAVGSGNFSKRAGSATSKGVGRDVETSSRVGARAQLYMVLTTGHRNSPQMQRRVVHRSHAGYICGAVCTENENIGLLKMLAAFTDVRTGHGIVGLLTEVRNVLALPLAPLVSGRGASGTRILYINERPVLALPDTLSNAEAVARLRAARRAGRMTWDIGVSERGPYGVCIRAQRGTLLRAVGVGARLPALVAVAGPDGPRASGAAGLRAALLAAGAIEYVDPEEAAGLRVASSLRSFVEGAPPGEPPFTHFELSTCAWMSHLAALIPFGNHQQAPRLMYATMHYRAEVMAQSARALVRMPRTTLEAPFATRPVVETRVAPAWRLDVSPAGEFARVAIMVQDGMLQEDGMIMERELIEAGWGRAYRYRTYTVQPDVGVRSSGALIEHPLHATPRVARLKARVNYGKLDARGLVREGQAVEAGDAIIGRTVTNLYTRVKEDFSIVLRPNEGGVVSSVLVAHGQPGGAGASPSTLVVRVTIRTTLTPTEGDKFSSRYGEKGTISAIVPRVDLPVTADGLPINAMVVPHRETSRMTVGELLAMTAATYAGLAGTFVDATMFERHPLGYWEDALAAAGWEKTTVRVRDGRSGALAETPVFVGMLQLVHLPHFAALKSYACRTAVKNPVTRQPADGRSRQGGLRAGEMEIDIMLAYGCGHTLNERQVISSDGASVWVCQRCGATDSVDAAWRDVLGDGRATPEPLCRACTRRSARLLHGNLGTAAADLDLLPDSSDDDADDDAYVESQPGEGAVRPDTDELMRASGAAALRDADRAAKARPPVMRRVLQPYALTLMASVLGLMNVDMRTHPRAICDAPHNDAPEVAPAGDLFGGPDPGADSLDVPPNVAPEVPPAGDLFGGPDPGTNPLDAPDVPPAGDLFGGAGPEGDSAGSGIAALVSTLEECPVVAIADSWPWWMAEGHQTEMDASMHLLAALGVTVTRSAWCGVSGPSVTCFEAMEAHEVAPRAARRARHESPEVPGRSWVWTHCPEARREHKSSVLLVGLERVHESFRVYPLVEPAPRHRYLQTPVSRSAMNISVVDVPGIMASKSFAEDVVGARLETNISWLGWHNGFKGVVRWTGQDDAEARGWDAPIIVPTSPTRVSPPATGVGAARSRAPILDAAPRAAAPRWDMSRFEVPEPGVAALACALAPAARAFVAEAARLRPGEASDNPYALVLRARIGVRAAPSGGPERPPEMRANMAPGVVVDRGFALWAEEAMSYNTMWARYTRSFRYTQDTELFGPEGRILASAHFRRKKEDADSLVHFAYTRDRVVHENTTRVSLAQPDARATRRAGSPDEEMPVDPLATPRGAGLGGIRSGDRSLIRAAHGGVDAAMSLWTEAERAPRIYRYGRLASPNWSGSGMVRASGDGTHVTRLAPMREVEPGLWQRPHAPRRTSMPTPAGRGAAGAIVRALVVRSDRARMPTSGADDGSPEAILARDPAREGAAGRDGGLSFGMQAIRFTKQFAWGAMVVRITYAFFGVNIQTLDTQHARVGTPACTIDIDFRHDHPAVATEPPERIALSLAFKVRNLLARPFEVLPSP